MHDYTPVSGFDLTRHDLGVLARHYLNTYYDHDYFWEWSGSTCGWERRLHAFCVQVLNKIFTVLGEDTFEMEVDEIHKKWKKEFDDLETWMKETPDAYGREEYLKRLEERKG